MTILLRHIWAILLPKARRSAIVMLALMLVSTALEMLSIGLVVPVLAFMTDNAGESFTFLRHRFDWHGDVPPTSLILLVLLCLVAVYAVKSLFLMFVAYCQARFVAVVQADTSERLFSVFMAQPWTFHLQRNSASLMHTIQESQGFAQACTSVLQVISELLVGTGLLAILIWFEPLGAAIVAGTLAFAFWMFNHVVRPRSRGWARERHQHVRSFLQHMQQALGGAKEVKLHGCEREVVDEFRTHADGAARMATLQWFVDQAPRAWFELLAVVALLMLTAVMVWQGKPMRSILPMLGLYATVAFRMLPSVNHATVAIQRLRNAEPMIRSLGRNLAMERSVPLPAPVTIVAFRDCIRLEHVSYRYPVGDASVLSDVDVRIPHGAAVGFIGGSGAGKTTLVDVLLGLLPPTSGRVTVDGLDIRDNLRGWQEIIGYVPQSIYLSDGSIRRSVAFGVPENVVDDDAVWRALAAARLDDFVRSLPQGIETVVGERGVRLSGGQRQRVAIARALYNDPQVLVLDEATSALDVDTERAVMDAVEALHGTKTLIIIAHRLSTVAACDVLHRIEGGRIIRSGPVAEVVAGSASDAR